jgi:hypothetical protein
MNDDVIERDDGDDVHIHINIVLSCALKANDSCLGKVF